MTPLQGKTFGLLTVLERAGTYVSSGGAKNPIWRCRCQCGNELTVRGSHLHSGNTRSCGCLNIKLAAERLRSHGMTYAKVYSVWKGMIQRCTNPKRVNWKHYGGRGISVCKRWYSFEKFFADMGEPAAGLTLERIDNNGDYKPSNCKWASLSEQLRNRRPYSKLNYGGVK